MLNAYTVNTLRFNPELCNNCVMCTTVCPHAVFLRMNGAVRLEYPERCMECGACQVNCPTGAISVDSGVGCATAMMITALKGQKEVSCG
ncbi:MAG: 4Fe-4S binding protein [Fidelibacterota bacterium]|nr:MAG: 4Fe-4S binding protein [Candidatus Neomarinimicrobiota bacterium]